MLPGRGGGVPGIAVGGQVSVGPGDGGVPVTVPVTAIPMFILKKIIFKNIYI